MEPRRTATSPIGNSARLRWWHHRTNDPNNPSNSVRFATRVNEWNVGLHIENRNTETVNGPLELTEEDKRKTTVFLVELANTLSAHRVA